MTDEEVEHQNRKWGTVKTLTSLPNRPLTNREYKALENSVFSASPLVGDVELQQVYALVFVKGETFLFCSWDPNTETWEVIVSLTQHEDDYCDIEASVFYDEETGEETPKFDPSADSLMVDIHDHVKAYVKHAYDKSNEYGVDELWFIMDTVKEINPTILSPTND